jgi:metal-dependent hydrolase (beta-lactamase superfamily II)
MIADNIKITILVDNQAGEGLVAEHGLVVCVGCSHAGLVNTLNYVRRLSVPKMLYLEGTKLESSGDKIFRRILVG